MAAALFTAVTNNNLEGVNAILDISGADPNVTQNGKTPLHIACKKGYVRIVRRLIAPGKPNRPINVNVRADYSDSTDEVMAYNGVTPLFIAASKGFRNIVTALLSVADIDVNAADYDTGSTPFLKAAENHFLEILHSLIEHDANYNTPDIFGTTPLHAAILNSGDNEARRMEVIEFLLDLVDINVNSLITAGTDMHKSPLYSVAEDCEPEIFELLLDAGADINAPTRNGSVYANREEFCEEISELISDNSGATNVASRANNVMNDPELVRSNAPRVNINNNNPVVVANNAGGAARDPEVVAANSVPARGGRRKTRKYRRTVRHRSAHRATTRRPKKAGKKQNKITKMK